MGRPISRTERDSLGAVEVPRDALWGAQTQRAVENFPISDLRLPRGFIEALGEIKASAAQVNAKLGLLDPRIAEAIVISATEVARGQHFDQFPVDVFQTGSGTSSNMNANEVIAHLASKASGLDVHANDHVNMSQSSNDVIPTAIHVSAARALRLLLLPALRRLARRIDAKSRKLSSVVTTGRTHLMDAMPITLGQELSGWAAQIRSGIDRVQAVEPRLGQLAQGGTAVGTGINAHPQFARRFASALSKRCGQRFVPAQNTFEALSCADTAVELSGALKVIACSLMKISNDLRWMNSGPLAGIGEIELPALQPGSSIMPGKVNPVAPEAVCMVAAQVIGNDATITVAGQSGNFQLNVMLPVIAYNLLQSVSILAQGANVLGDLAIKDFKVNRKRMEASLERNPILATALNPVIGYEQSAKMAKAAYLSGRPIRDVAREMCDLSEAELERLLDPEALTRGGLPGR